MEKQVQRVRGMNDILPDDVYRWHYIESKIREIASLYQYEELRSPIVEFTDLFQRGVGDTTDIVQKEMFTFSIKKDGAQDKIDQKSLTLRPEGTASTVRAYVNAKMYGIPQTTKLYYMGPMFRYEKPQAGRHRQFTQFGIEALGSKHPGLDAEVIAFADSLFKKLGLKNIRLEINSVGCPVCRQEHKEALMKALGPIKNDLCTDCQGRFEKNPLRILDCKVPKCQELSKDVPLLDQHLCENCASHHSEVKKYLDDLDISYVENPRLVRGLDYYTQTAFEFIEDSIGAQSTVCGGGRYDGLVEQLGGPETPGIGFAMGLERLLLVIEDQGIELEGELGVDVYVLALGYDANHYASSLINKLRVQGLICEKDYLDRSMKSQMKAADRLQAKYVIILGDNEIKEGLAPVREMATGEQVNIKLDELVDYMSKKI